MVRVKGAVNHHLYKREETFWVRYEKNSKVLKRSLDTKSITEARIRRDEYIADFLGNRVKFRGSKLVQDYFEEFIELKSHKATNTVYSLKNSWNKHLKEHFGDLLLDDVTEGEWIRFVTWKRSQPKMAHRKFFNDRKNLSMFMHWAFREGYTSKAPKLPNVDPPSKKGKVYTDQEINLLLGNASTDLQLQIICGYTMGMRKGEILSLEWIQIDFKLNSIHLPAEKVKTRKERTFAISPECIEKLKVRSLNSASEWVFPSPSDLSKSVGPTGNKTAWMSCKRRSGVKGTFHSLRHSFLTKAFQASPFSAQICHYAGLSLEVAQKVYLHFTLEDIRSVASLVKPVPNSVHDKNQENNENGNTESNKEVNWSARLDLNQRPLAPQEYPYLPKDTSK